MLRGNQVGVISSLLGILALACFLAPTAPAQDRDAKLMQAVHSRDNTELRMLLTDGADPNTRIKNQRTPLMEAASDGYADTARILLEFGAEVNAKDSMGWTALFCAAFSGRTDTVKALIAKGADLNAKDDEGRTPLFWASFSGDADVVRALLDRGARINDTDNHGWTALMSAVDLGHVDAAKVLLEKGADVQVRTKDGSTALRLAEKYKYYNLAALLREASHEPPPKSSSNSNSNDAPVSPAPSPAAPKVDPEKMVATTPSAPSQESHSAPSHSDVLNQRLIESAEAGDTSEVLSLIRAGAGVNARSATYGDTALIRASARGHADTVRALLDRGGEVDARDSAGRTALMEAASEGYTETVSLLIEKGATINALDKEGWTPLFWAAYSRRTDTVRFLLAKGADVNAVNKYQDTALIHAAYGGDTPTVLVLLENHADIDRRDDMGRTALIEASRQGHPETVRVLLQHGAASGIQANDGSTALSLAEKLQYTEIANLISNPSATSPSTTSLSTQTSDPATPASATKEPPNSSPESAAPQQSTASPSHSGESEHRPDNIHSSDPLASAVESLAKKTQAQAFYRMGLSMRLVEDYWPQSNRIAERAASSILGDLTAVGAPDNLVVLAQRASMQLAIPPAERESSIRANISDLHNNLTIYCLGQSAQKFFFSAGGFTYDMNQLGQELAKSQHSENQTEQTRMSLLPIATNLTSQCAATTECKIRGLAYLSQAANLLQQPSLQAADGSALQKLCDQISIALGTDESLTAN